MEQIRIIKTTPNSFRLGEKELLYYVGVIEENSGSNIKRDVDFVFDSLSGKRLLAIDRKNQVACCLLDESISIRDIHEDMVLDAEIRGIKMKDNDIHFVSLLEP